MVNVTDIPVIDFLEQVGQIGLWLQAIGIVVILIIIFNTIGFFINRRRMKEVYSIKEDMKRIEDKIDKIVMQTQKTQK